MGAHDAVMAARRAAVASGAVAARHTAGVWRASTSPNCWTVYATGGVVVAGGTAWGIPGLMPEALANARLIAAAPLMYELLRAVHDQHYDDPNPAALARTVDEIGELLDQLKGR